MEPKEKSIDVICKENGYCYRREHDRKKYCIVRATDCPFYDFDNALKVPRRSVGFGNNGSYNNTFNLCKILE